MTADVDAGVARSGSVDHLRLQVAAGYLALQALGGIVLWVLIDASDVVRSGFEVVDGLPEVTNGFFWADMAVVATSALAAWALWTGRAWGVLAAGATAGGVVYPTVYLLAYVLDTGGQAAPALVVMLGVSCLCCWATALAWRSRPT